MVDRRQVDWMLDEAGRAARHAEELSDDLTAADRARLLEAASRLQAAAGVVVTREDVERAARVLGESMMAATLLAGAVLRSPTIRLAGGVATVAAIARTLAVHRTNRDRPSSGT